jgi:uncharacterized membrane protein YtjA (UPF0391 family)
MIRWVLFFLLVSVIAGALGFTGLSHASAEIAKVICMVFICLFLIAIVLLVME